MLYRYIDGSGNQYILEGLNIRYQPISVEMSSSGFYSGGELKEIQVSSEAMAELMQLLELGVENTSIHKTHRELGTGTILLTQSEKIKRYILPRRSTEKRAIDAMLKVLMTV